MDLTEAEDIKRWKANTEELYKKILTWITMMVTQPEADILECVVKWSLGNTAANKASRDDGISAKLFQILKDDVV